eukprot:TRINITY_DN2931_c0_g1_i1.p2 TRINITY_DN2931_c0_g1~~TRINITY_DN2931_c0_g1_i1.p2  ORF type:complete len:512 (+),score=221.57 TRINITY_DN2931_c0_g1_i1:80-1615(+)
MRIFEFFSGIGGMRLAVEEALGPRAADVAEITAFDISSVPNEVYQHNFRPMSAKAAKKAQKRAAKEGKAEEPAPAPAAPERPGTTMKGLRSCRLVPKLIEQLTLKDLDGKADLWTMSPPCQPFTTTANAKGKGDEDARCEGFLALLRALEDMEHPPHRILLENVKGFMDTKALDMMKFVLQKRGYTYRQYLLSPLTVGIPNNRTRYYLLCERGARFGEPGEEARTDGVHVDLTGTPRTREEVKEYAALLVEHARRGGRSGPCEEGDVHTAPPPEEEGDEADEGEGAAPTDAEPAAAPAPPIQVCAEKFPALNVRLLAEYVEDGVVHEAEAEADPPAASPAKRKHDAIAEDAPPAKKQKQEKERAAWRAPRPTGRAARKISLFLSKDTLAKPYAKGLSIVTKEEGVTFCFTKNYGKVLHRASGSLYYDPTPPPPGPLLKSLNRDDLVSHHGQVRLFTPRELLNLMGFPAWFEFPADMPLIQRYRCIGNSVSVHAVAAVAKILLSEEDPAPSS